MIPPSHMKWRSYSTMARAMMEEGKDEFYYITAMNENYPQPSMPDGVETDIVKGLYRVETRGASERPSPRLRRNSAASVGGRPSTGNRLGRRRGGVQRDQLLGTRARRTRVRAAQPAKSGLAQETSHVARHLSGRSPIIAATDYVRAYPQMIAA